MPFETSNALSASRCHSGDLGNTTNQRGPCACYGADQMKDSKGFAVPDLEPSIVKDSFDCERGVLIEIMDTSTSSQTLDCGEGSQPQPPVPIEPVTSFLAAQEESKELEDVEEEKIEIFAQEYKSLVGSRTSHTQHRKSFSTTKYIQQKHDKGEANISSDQSHGLLGHEDPSDSNLRKLAETKSPSTPRTTRRSFLLGGRNNLHRTDANAAARKERKLGKNMRPSNDVDDLPIFFDAMTTSYTAGSGEDDGVLSQSQPSESEDCQALAALANGSSEVSVELHETVDEDLVSPRMRRRSLRFSLTGSKTTEKAPSHDPDKVAPNTVAQSSPRVFKKLLFGTGKQKDTQQQVHAPEPIQQPQQVIQPQDHDSYQTPQQLTRPRIRVAPSLPTIEASPTLPADLESPGVLSSNRLHALAAINTDPTLDIVLDGNESDDGEGNQLEQPNGMHQGGSESDFDEIANHVALADSSVSSLEQRRAGSHEKGDSRNEIDIDLGSNDAYFRSENGFFAAQEWNDNARLDKDFPHQIPGTSDSTGGKKDELLENHNESIYLQELQEQRRATLADTLSDEELARQLQDELKGTCELDASDHRKLSYDTESDADMAAEVATILMREELDAFRSDDTSTLTLNESSVEEQRRILDQIHREREQLRINDSIARTRAPSEPAASPYRDHTHGIPIHRQSDSLSRQTAPRGNAVQSNETQEEEQRRREAFERQFYDRTTGAVEVTPVERERVRRLEALGSQSYHGGNRNQYLRQMYSQSPSHSYAQPNPVRPMSTGPDDWEASQRRALMEFERARLLQSQTSYSNHSSVPAEFDPRHAYPWQQTRIRPPQQRSPGGIDHWGQSELLRRGEGMTQRAVRSGQAHIVLCQGCGNRLHAPGQ